MNDLKLGLAIILCAHLTGGCTPPGRGNESITATQDCVSVSGDEFNKLSIAAEQYFLAEVQARVTHYEVVSVQKCGVLTVVVIEASTTDHEASRLWQVWTDPSQPFMRLGRPM